MQLQVISGLLVLCIITVSGLVLFSTVKTSLFRELREKHLLTTLKASQSSFQAALQRAIETSELLAEDPTLTSWFMDGEVNESLKILSLKRLVYLQKNYDYSAVFATNRITKNCWSHDDGILDTVSENDPADNWFFDAIDKKTKISLNFDYNRELDKTMLFVNVLMGNKMNPYGIAGVELDISMLMEEFDKHKISKNSCLLIVDSLGTVKVSSKTNEINRPLGSKVPADVLDGILQNDSASVMSNTLVANQRVELVSMPVGTTKYKLLMLVPDDELFPVLGIIKRQTMIFSVVFSILILMIVRMLSRRMITLPLLRLKKQSKHWAEGHLHVDSDSYLLKRKDEIGSLAKSFEIMRRHLANNMTELNMLNDSLIRDKQQLKHVNEQLNVALEKASESERLTQSFLANISHEIRTPMNSIMGFSQLLQQSGVGEEEQRYYLDIVIKSERQLLAILDSIINLSKIESGVLKAKWSKINICELVRESCDIYQIQAQEKGLVLICHSCQGNPDINIVSDPTLIQMVLNNLICNAIKFTDKGQVEVRCSRKNGGVTIMVKDTGIGIAAKDKEYIFEPFRQVEPVQAAKTNGAGLGLAIVNKIVDMLGGKIILETELNKGSVFLLELPEGN